MWIILTLVAVFLWSLVNISDSYLVERNKHIGHPIGSLVLFSSLFGFIAALAIFIFAGGSSFSLGSSDIILLVIAGFCNLLWIVFYLNALSHDDVSSVVPWFLTAPLFAYILGYFVLGENLLPSQLVGGAIILIGGLVLSIKTNREEGVKKGYKIAWKPIILMTLASLLIAIWGILFKFVGKDSGFWVASFWEHIGLGIAGIIVLVFIKPYREGFSLMLKQSGRSILALNLFSESATIIGNLLANYALLLTPVTMVFLLEVSQPIVVFLLGIICTIFFPKVLKEDISYRNLVHKGVSIVIMLVGALMLVI
jgi:drug/metabolite transporter (DMT)-like permease